MKTFLRVCGFLCITSIAAYGTQATARKPEELSNLSLIATTNGQILTFGIRSDVTQGKPNCGKMFNYAIDSHSYGGASAISVLFAVRDHRLMAKDKIIKVEVFGNGSCALSPFAEKVDVMSVYANSKLVFSAGPGVKDRVGKALTLDGTFSSPRNYPDKAHHAPPIILNMTTARKSQSLASLLTEYRNDACSMNLGDLSQKYYSKETRYGLIDRLTQRILKSQIDAIIPKGTQEAALGTDKDSCAKLRQTALAMPGTYGELISGDTATAVWVDPTGIVRSAALIREDGDWLIDVSFSFGL
jgi:hypothetical protein